MEIEHPAIMSAQALVEIDQSIDGARSIEQSIEHPAIMIAQALVEIEHPAIMSAQVLVDISSSDSESELLR